MATFCTLGPFRLDTQDDLLFHGSDPVALGRRAIALLRALVERPGAVVSKDALIEAAWPGQAVEKSNLTVQIAALRRVLGETPGGDRWIETMPRRGYRFVGPVVKEEEKDATEASQADAAAPDLAAAQHNDAERRQITAMSCELVGNAERADGMDLEDWREAVSTFRHCVSETTEHHEGFIYRHLGNDVLVLFGYPEAHEHDAERAVRAGLELGAAVRALRPDADVQLRCRVGIATGTVIIGDGYGIGEGRDREIVGDTPDLATRLQISAQTDTVVIDPATRRLIGNLFDCRELGAIEANGGTASTRGWQVLGESLVESRFEALRGPALSSLIGRDEEVDLLLRRWERAKAGDGQIVLVSGEPGIGKSRLTAALEERLHGEPHLRLRYFCSPYHQDSALFPSVDQLGRAAGFARDDPAAAKLQKLEALLARADPPDKDVALLADLMGLPSSGRHPLPSLSPQRKKERTLEALVRQLEGLARRQPVMVVFEDAHWIDPTSLELLDLTIESVRSLPVLLIVTYRPEFQPPWTGQPQVTTLTLNRLDRPDRKALVERIARRKLLPVEVTAQIVDRTDGVPLFVEELTKSVLESGLLREEADRYVLDGALPPLAIPTGLNFSLMARLDRLASARQVAQIGAVIGRDFSYELLSAVSRLPADQLQLALAHLVASELVFQRGTPPDAHYSFKHALVRDAAHDTLLRRARQQLHAQIAEALETHSPELMDAQPELFAQHYTDAGLNEKAVDYWLQAGRASSARAAWAEAEAQLSKGLAQLTPLSDSRERRDKELALLSALASVQGLRRGISQPLVGETRARAIELWKELGHPSEFTTLLVFQYAWHLSRGEFDRGRHLAEDLLHGGEERRDNASVLLGHLIVGISDWYSGAFASARAHLEKVAWLDWHWRLYALAALGWALACLGYADRARACAAAAIEEARRFPRRDMLLNVLQTATKILVIIGDDRPVAALADDLFFLSQEVGVPGFWMNALTYRGWVKIRSGKTADGLALLREGADAMRAIEHCVPAHHYAYEADAEAGLGHREAALVISNEALRMTRTRGENWLEAELVRRRGELLRDRDAVAEELFCEAVEIAQRQQAKLWELRAATCLARLWHDQGRRAEAHDLLAPVYGWFTEGLDTPDLKEAKALLDELA